MGRAENTTTSHDLLRQPTLSSSNVSFGKDELSYLSFVRRQKARPGAISMPRRDVLCNKGLKEEIDELIQSGLWEVRTHQPHRGVDPKGGNIVLYPTHLATDLCGKISQIRPGALDPILDLMPTATTIKSVTVLPNASSRANKLNGVAVKFNEKQERWWSELAKLKMSYGRGLSVFALGISFDEFCNRLQDLLNITYGFGRITDGLKYVQFLMDDSGGSYMAIAAGPTHNEKESISGSLFAIQDLKEAVGLVEIINKISSERRLDIARSLAHMFGVGEVELFTDSRYIDLDAERAVVTSGGAMSSHHNTKPFALGLGGVLLCKASDADHLVPIGSGPNYPLGEGQMIELPTGVSRNNLTVKDASPSHIDVVRKLTSGLEVIVNLQVVGIGYNAGWAKNGREIATFD